MSIVQTGTFASLDSSSHLHLALAQVYASDFDVNQKDVDTSIPAFQRGLNKIRAYTEKAAKEGADVVCFPEYFLTGAKLETWHAVRTEGGPRPHRADSLDDKNGSGPKRKRTMDLENEQEVSQREEEEEAHWIEEVCSLAKELDVNILVGTVVEVGHHVPHRQDQEGRDKLFNTAYFIAREGDVRGRYTKRNLWHPERAPLTAAHPSTHPHPPLFTFTTRRNPTTPIKAGIQICWDLAFPESFRQLLSSSEGGKVVDGPDVVFVPTCWFATDAGQLGLSWNKSPSGEATILDSLSFARSLECEAVLAMINIAGKEWDEETDGKKDAKELAEGDPIGVGRTQLVSPFLGTVGRLDGPQEGLLLGSVDLKMLKDVREVYKIRQDLAESS